MTRRTPPSLALLVAALLATLASASSANTGAPVTPAMTQATTTLSFDALARECAPTVHPTTLRALVRTESSWNPYAIGVVGTHLARQPRTHAEAVATARDLERKGLNFSLGLGQVNRHNLARYGESYDTVFDPCRNLKAGAAILQDCYERARVQRPQPQQALRAAFSCYYSGNFTRGFRPDKTGEPSYVQKVVANAAAPARPIVVVPAIEPEGGQAAVVPAPVAGPSVAPRAATPVRQASRTEPNAPAAPWVSIAEPPVPAGNAAPAAGMGASAVLVRPSVTRTSPTPATPTPRHAAPAEAPFVQIIH